MTVLGSGNEKSDDKEQLVGKEDVATIMPNRHRLVKLKKRRSILTLILLVGFLFIFLCGIFLTVCFIKRIGPFRRHLEGKYPVGSKRLNGHKVYESFEVTDSYVLIHVPPFNTKHGTFDSTQTLHIIDKNLTVIQHGDMCLVKPWIGPHILKDDWFHKIRARSGFNHHIPRRFVSNHFRIDKHQLPENFLRDSVHSLADAICNPRPVFRLMVMIRNRPFPTCYVRCTGCVAKSFTWQIIGGRRCRVCSCLPRGQTTKAMPRLQSSNQVDANCNSVRCEDKCAGKKLIGCFQCRCEDKKVEQVDQPRLKPMINTIKLDPFIVHAEGAGQVVATEVPIMHEREPFGPIFAEGAGPVVATEVPILHEREPFGPIFASKDRKKRSAESKCSLTAKIYEGYSPMDFNDEVTVDYVYVC